jgi:hypothetical protein
MKRSKGTGEQTRRPRAWIAAALAILVAAAAGLMLIRAGEGPPAWSDTFESRVEMLALIETLNADILASTSATQSLEDWCRDHRMADDPRIVARRVRGVDKVPSAEQMQRLSVTRTDEVKYRRVELRCGVHVLSEADNWYVPGRLTADMNQLLETTETPFGRAVRPLGPYRRTFAAEEKWLPLADGWELEPRGWSLPRRAPLMTLPKELFEHRAVLYTAQGQPFSEVSEMYQGQLLAFRRAR